MIPRTRTRRARWPFALLVAASLPASAARADEPSQAAATAPPDEDEEARPGSARPAGPDDLSGRFLLDASFGVVGFSGGVANGRPLGSLASGGASFGAGASYGLTRYAALELSGSLGLLGAPSSCAACTARTLAFGLGLTYHLVQGLAVDPWLSFGMGYRSMAFEVPDTSASLLGGVTSGTYRSIDFARIGLGTDFYPVPSVGLGPFVEADIGYPFSRPDPDPGGAVHGFFQLGLRIALMPAGRTTSARRESARR